MRPLRAAGVLGSLGLLLCAGAQAQERQLDYEMLSVKATLLADGALEIDERHWLVLTGEWNGTERRFDVGRGQSLELVRVSRWDPETRSEIRMTEDPLVRSVNSWAYFKDTFRMRARLPEDLALDREVVAYRLVYRLRGVLAKTGDTYELDHDFAFGNRDGAIRRFKLALEFAPEWRAAEPLPASFAEQSLPAGTSFPLTLTLDYLGDTPPEVGAPGGARPAGGLDVRDDLFEGVLLALLGLFLLAMVWLRRAQPERFAGLEVQVVPSKERELLRQMRQSWKPEHCAVLWPRGGDNLGSSLVLRLIRDGCIVHLSDEEGGGERLEIKDRGKAGTSALAALERELFLGENEIQLSRLRRYYRKTGFDLSKCVRQPVEEEVDEIVRQKFGAPLRSSALDWIPWAMLGLLACASGLLLAETFGSSRYGFVFGAAGELILVLAVLLVMACPALWLTVAASKRSFGLLRWAVGLSVLMIPPLFMVSSQTFVVRSQGPLNQLAHFLLGVAVVLWALRRLHDAQGRGFALASRELAPQVAALRARLERGKALEPWQQLYAGALGLLDSTDRWAHVAPEFDPNDPLYRHRPGSAGGSRPSPALAGGGAFGGAGASASWGAVSSFSSVSAPRGWSSSGSSSGGSRSGGGGGGGW